MNLTLARRPSSRVSTTGELYVNGSPERFCFTLEDREREIDGRPVSEWKIPGVTAIPRGRYAVDVTWSPRFRRRLPLLQDVPGFAGVRIHSGNYPSDTEGCILVGLDWSAEWPDSIGNSRAALGLVLSRIDAARFSGEEVWIDVKGGDR